MQKIQLLFLTFVILSGCQSKATSTEPWATHTGHVLFLGNSLTSTNDLAGTFRDLTIGGGYDVGVQTIAPSSTALIDFLSIPSVLAVIDGSKWDYVVMQQGTTSLPVCRDTLILSAQLLDPHVRSTGAKPAFMMSWPSVDRKFAFPAVHNSFAQAAQTVDGVFLPVGDAWLEAWKINPDEPLYDGDGYHPSPEATYLAALVIYEKLTGGDARRLPVDVVAGANHITLAADVVRRLQQAAHAANALPVPHVVPVPTVPSAPITC